jgi:hypothetical protein
MNYLSIVLCSVLTLTVALGSRTSHAQGWRCSGDMCDDVIINDVADTTVANWPATQILAMPGLPYTCQTKSDVCRHCATNGGPGTPDGAASGITATSVVGGTIPWSIGLSGAGNLRSFLFGSFTASADILGTIGVSSDGSSWPGTEINYHFLDACDPNTGACTEVPAFPSGSTGVTDLGRFDWATPAGGFWNSSLTFQFIVPTADIVISCRIGYANEVTVSPGGTHVTVSYPVAWTPVQDVLAEAIRNQFRAAARSVTN